MISPSKFRLAYHLSRPADVQRMREIIDPTRRREQAIVLVNQRFVIDEFIDVIGDDAYIVMQTRQALNQMSIASMPPSPSVASPGTIKTSTRIEDYPPISPARSFTVRDFFAVQAFLVENGFAVQNVDHHMCLNVDAEDAQPDDLILFTNAPPPVFPGAQPKFGIVINGKVYDAEQISLRIPNVDVVRAYLGNPFLFTPEPQVAAVDPGPSISLTAPTSGKSNPMTSLS